MLFTRVNPPLECFCGRSYTYPQDLEEHRRARGHFPSHKCTGLCKHPALGPHNGQNRACGYCGKVCERLDIFEDHAIATGHCFCSDCDVYFSSRQSWEDHRKSAKHASEFKCCDCDISFNDVHALVAHMESRAHRRPLRPKTARQDKKKSLPVSSSTNCAKCKRDFQSSQSLQQHLTSLKHKPLSRLDCPVGTNCRGSFPSPSALVHHLESGRCSSGMRREEVHQIVESYDLGIICHSPAASLTSSTSGLQVYTPVESDSWVLTSDTESEWSLLTPSACGSAEDSLEQWSLLGDPESQRRGSLSFGSTTLQTLRCPICPSKRAKFSTLHALQQHMDSPLHSPKVYKCPSLGSKLDVTRQVKLFSTLGGLCQHLESDSCKGGKRALLHFVAFIQGELEKLGFGKMELLL
jgi:hypothetical protein